MDSARRDFGIQHSDTDTPKTPTHTHYTQLERVDFSSVLAIHSLKIGALAALTRRVYKLKTALNEHSWQYVTLNPVTHRFFLDLVKTLREL